MSSAGIYWLVISTLFSISCMTSSARHLDKGDHITTPRSRWYLYTYEAEICVFVYNLHSLHWLCKWRLFNLHWLCVLSQLHCMPLNHENPFQNIICCCCFYQGAGDEVAGIKGIIINIVLTSLGLLTWCISTTALKLLTVHRWLIIAYKNNTLKIP